MFSPTRRRGYLVGAPTCIRARLASSKRNAAGHSPGRCACRGRPSQPSSGNIWPNCARNPAHTARGSPGGRRSALPPGKQDPIVMSARWERGDEQQNL